jgi:hypothetical protein
MKLQSKEDYRAAQLPHFLAIAALGLYINPDNAEAMKANEAEINNRALKMVHAMNSVLESWNNQVTGRLNG